MKRLTYVDKDPMSYPDHRSRRFHQTRTRNIERELRKFFETRLVYDLMSFNVDLKLKLFKPHILITHCPYDPKEGYGRSKARLRTIIKSYPRTRVYVYTGASSGDISSEEFFEMGALGVVRKDDETKDVETLLECLNALGKGIRFDHSPY